MSAILAEKIAQAEKVSIAISSEMLYNNIATI